MNPISYYLITLIVFGIVVLLSIILNDVSLLFEIVGSTVSWFMVIVLPGIFYIISYHKLHLNSQEKQNRLMYLTSCFLIAIGVFCMIGLNAWVIVKEFS